MIDFKSVFASGGVWTALFGLLAAVLIAAGVLPEDFDTAGAYAAILALVSALSGFFRFRATKQLAVNPRKAEMAAWRRR